MDSPWRYILHADLDAFYASVEQHDNPGLKGKAVVVGGPPESRGVVAAASYEARRYGIHSALPMRTAVKLCPDLVRVSPRFDRYRQVSHTIMETFLELTSLVEPLSLDEAYMDISTVVPRSMEEGAARALKERVRDRSGLAITIGGGTTKSVAKIASQIAKPDGLLMVQPGTEEEFLAPLDVGMLWGVGPKTAAALRNDGVDTLGQLAEMDDGTLVRKFGKRGPEMRQRALGLEQDAVAPHRETKSISSETTLATDVGDPAEITRYVESLAGEVAEQMGRKHLRCKTVWIKLRLADFTTFTRQKTLPEPTDRNEVITASARDLLALELEDGRMFRLVGVGVGNFQEDFQMPLLPPLSYTD
ncbi:MAG: DNA polymerase IV [Dehalococcoidia bacterium]|nr:DNA polymerase IV [Dehalococcoidia bacterium]